MKNINTASLDCGIDGVNIKFLSEFETEQELYYFQRSNSNRTIKYGLLKKLGLKNGLVEYSIFINLPQTIRNSNIQPYSFVDCTKYMRVYQMLTEQLNDIFDFDISDLMLGNWVTHADRATALALTKIMLMPDYEKEFSERYKTILSEKIRKPEQIEHEKAVEPILKEMGTKLGKLFMCSFHLKQAMKSYHN